MRLRRTSHILAVLGGVVGVCILALFLLPFLWIALTSLKPVAETYRIPPTFFPEKPTLLAYKNVFAKNPFGSYFLNSVITSGGATLATLFLASLAAFGLAYLRIPLRTYLLVFILGSYMFPGPVTLVPLYELLKRIHLLNALTGLLLLYITKSLPFAIWMLTGYFRKLPADLCDAARIDGCSSFGILGKVILPLAKPGLLASGLFSFVISWNDFLFAYVFLGQESKFTITLGLARFITQLEIYWDEMSAAAIVALAPVVIAFLIFSKHFVRGLAAGATKG